MIGLGSIALNSFGSGTLTIKDLEGFHKEDCLYVEPKGLKLKLKLDCEDVSLIMNYCIEKRVKRLFFDAVSSTLKCNP